ncbi:MAG: PQQ-binding-like beta-propeller repeat protein [bacterium]
MLKIRKRVTEKPDMANAQTDEPTRQKSLRLWPGVLAAALLWLARFGLKVFVPGFKGFSLGAQGGLIGAVAVVVWWAFLSRAAWFERLGAIVLMIVGLGATWSLKHESMGPLWLFTYAIPILCVAFVAWAVATRRLADGSRRATMVATVVVACGAWTLARTEGINGDHVANFAWRWTETSEERLMARAGDAPAALPSAPASESAPKEQLMLPASDKPTLHPSAPASASTPAERLLAQAGDEPTALPPAPAATKTSTDWPGFRGSQRDGIVRGVQIETNWSASPPIELWRRPIGLGWSSFAVHGDLFYTQEQRGDDEVVACYDATTGEPVWRHHDAARFFESNAGAGPRATPTLSNGGVYTFGATGILNALDARDGSVVWSRNLASDSSRKVPVWGFASSPLVVDDLVIVAAAGQIVAYDLATGKSRWLGPNGGEGYSSPHLMTLDGVAQILLLSGAGVTSFAPADGKLIWQHHWKGFPIVQPALTADGDLLITASGESGTRLISVARAPDGWTVQERWTSLGLKPYFNDFVVHEGHAFGFDARILACINLKDGKRKWKGGRYGSGQLVLLPDQDLLLVLSEDGELALVKATPEHFTELARFPAIAGKTWNHPVLAGDVLLVRNGQEMAAFRLPLASR